MSRPLRIQYPDAWYHVMNRGRRGEQVFETKKDYLSFIDLLEELDEFFNVGHRTFVWVIPRYSGHALMTWDAPGFLLG